MMVLLFLVGVLRWHLPWWQLAPLLLAASLVDGISRAVGRDVWAEMKRDWRTWRAYRRQRN